MSFRAPQTPDDWQCAVNAADLGVRLGRLDSKAAGDLDWDACRDSLGRGLQLGYLPESIAAQNARNASVNAEEFNDLCDFEEAE